MSKNFVTVGIIARNEAKDIGNTISSLIKQDYPKNKWELIVVDGNSEDNTRTIIINKLKNSSVKNKIVNELDFYGEHKGRSFARNLIVKLSNKNAKYIAFIDADCVASKKWLSSLVDGMEKVDKLVCGGGGPRLMKKTNNVTEKIINIYLTKTIGGGYADGMSEKSVEYLNSISNHNAVYLKKVLLKHKYDNKLYNADDLELNFRLKERGFYFVNIPLAKNWRSEEKSIFGFAKNMFNYGNAMGKTMKKHHKIIRWYALLPPLFVVYLFFLPLIYHNLIYLFPLCLYLILGLIIAVQGVYFYRSFVGLLSPVLMIIHHLSYGLGFWGAVSGK